MNQIEFKSMSTEELWALHEEVAKRLAEALTVEKCLLESRLKLLQRGIEISPPAGKSPVAKFAGRQAAALAVFRCRDAERQVVKIQGVESQVVERAAPLSRGRAKIPESGAAV